MLGRLGKILERRQRPSDQHGPRHHQRHKRNERQPHPADGKGPLPATMPHTEIEPTAIR